MSSNELLRMLRDKLLNTYESLVAEYKDPLVELRGGSLASISFLYFTASWCAPCISFMETVRTLARRYGGRVVFYKVNVDENMDLVERFNVDYIPAFVAIFEGRVVERVYGVVSYGRLENVVRKVLDLRG